MSERCVGDEALGLQRTFLLSLSLFSLNLFSLSLSQLRALPIFQHIPLVSSLDKSRTMSARWTSDGEKKCAKKGEKKK